MKKIVVHCTNCTKKMKILNKMAKYKCPHCSNIYKFNFFKFIFVNIENFFMGITNKIITKFTNMKNTYSYMKRVKKNMNSDPNWSNYRKQKLEEKNSSSFFKDKLKSLFK